MSNSQSATLAACPRVLIVEDNFENVALMRAFLENLSLSLDFAENGVAALEKRRLNDYDLILMDMQMPVMDGYAATRGIRAWEEANGQRRVPVIALTAHASSGSRGDSVGAGCDGYLAKPLEKHDLLEAIAKFGQPANREQAPGELSDGQGQALSPAIRARRPVFLANRWRDLEKLQDALAVRDFAAIRTIAHNCKGIGAGYGFPEISSLGAELSTAAKAFDTDKLRESLGDFERCLVTASYSVN
jgi:CheY-like chemotaxis protein